MSAIDDIEDYIQTMRLVGKRVDCVTVSLDAYNALKKKDGNGVSLIDGVMYYGRIPIRTQAKLSSNEKG